jgi:tetratricopeptide (TPR) repeat protein
MKRLGLLLICILLAGGCQRDPRGAPTDGAPVVDSVLLAFLSRARSAHHRADALEERDDDARAILELEAVASGPRPAYPEVDEVLADTRARLADLRSRQGDFAAAERDLKVGLELAPTRNYFRGHLFEVRGLLEERRVKVLQAGGDSAGAEAARTRALQAFEQAMTIQEEVIRNALAGDASP